MMITGHRRAFVTEPDGRHHRTEWPWLLEQPSGMSGRPGVWRSGSGCAGRRATARQQPAGDPMVDWCGVATVPIPTGHRSSSGGFIRCDVPDR
jgi:hypothetical protein